jgi:hypothetical protein
MSETRESKALKWVATIWSVASVVFVLTFILGEAFGGHGAKPTGTEWVGLAFWPGGVIVGLVIAWFRKGLGGTIAIASLIVFYFWHLLERGKFPGGPYFLLVAAPGILFLLSSLLSRPQHQTRSA